MKKPIFITFLIVVFCLFMGQMAFSIEDTTTDTDTSESKFQSRELLTQTLLSGQPAPETGTGDPGSTEPSTEPTLDARVSAFVESLSDEQVFAFNRALNNAVNSQLYSEIIYDMDLLESLDVATLTPQTINAVTKALEEEAKFTKLYEKTGNEKFLEKAQSQKAKFLAKGGIETTEGDTGTVDQGTGSDTDIDTNAALDMAKADIKGASKFAAKNANKEAKMAAKAAKKEAKLAAKAAKSEAKEAKKQSNKNKGKGKGKGKGKKK